MNPYTRLPARAGLFSGPYKQCGIVTVISEITKTMVNNDQPSVPALPVGKLDNPFAVDRTGVPFSLAMSTPVWNCAAVERRYPRAKKMWAAR